MAIDIIVPRLGWSMEEGAFCRWLKQDGEQVREGDGLFELEGDKATQVVESFDAGILHIPIDGPKPGDIVKVGQLLGLLLAKNEPLPTTKTTTGPSENQAAGAHSPAAGLAEASPVPGKRVFQARGQTMPDRVQGSPSLRRLARERGVDVRSLLPDAVIAQPSTEPPAARSQSDARNGTMTVATVDKIRISPRAARLASQLGIPIEGIVGTGKDGRIRERDVQAASGSAKSSSLAHNGAASVAGGAGDAKAAPISALRRTIANRMMAAAHQAAAVTLTSQADASELVSFRQDFKRTQTDRGIMAPSFTALFTKLAAAALSQHPALLQQWSNDELITPQGLHVSVAVDTPHGLVTPVIRDVAARSLLDVSNELTALAERARRRQLTTEQMQDGVFTVSSLGAFRVDAFTPILNPPQTAILGVGRIHEAPVVKDGGLAVGNVVSLSLTFDHRVIDGAPAAAFLTTLCEAIERPMPWLIT
jgi:pyruvate dehydrogenase E2 component (dihydrolipoamide acetyltransferase)